MAVSTCDWMHNGFIIDEEKMSKSLGNVFNIKDVTEMYEPLVLRFFLLTGTHYRNPINFSDAMLEESSARIAYFYEHSARLNNSSRTPMNRTRASFPTLN